MPKLSVDRKIKRVILPSSVPEDEAWVEIYDQVLTGDIIGVADMGDNKSLATITTLTNIIKAWNFTDDKGVVVPITIDSVKLLQVSDMMAIIEEVQGMQAKPLSKSKKNS